jgi:hypothetical protein
VLTVGLTANVSPASASPTKDCSAAAAGEEKALEKAQTCGIEVAVTDATTETDQVTALPTGELRREISMAPVRMRKDEGWVPIDLTLEKQNDGTIAPKAYPGSVVVSGATAETGEHDLASIALGDKSVALRWDGPLPAPVLDGNTATYPEVKPGIDLRVEATVNGVESFYVVKNRAAAAHVKKLTVPITGPNVASHRLAPNGTLSLFDNDGELMATSPTPLMWDARTDRVTGGPAVTKPMASAAVPRKSVGNASAASRAARAGVDLTITPDASFLASPQTVYPVTIDPKINLYRTGWDAWVSEGLTTPQGSSTLLKIGRWSGVVSRSFLKFDTRWGIGRHITQATMEFYNYKSSGCVNSGWEIWSTDEPSTLSPLWTSQPAWKNREGAGTASAGGPNSCTSGSWIGIDTTSLFQRQADAGIEAWWMGVRATDESDVNSGKQFYSINSENTLLAPRAVVYYKDPPTVSQRAIALDNDATTVKSTCNTGSTRPVVNTLTPQLRAIFSHASDTVVGGDFEFADLNGNTLGVQSVDDVPEGSIATVWIPDDALTNGASYKWRARGRESGTVYAGAYSTWCEFRVKATWTSPPGVAVDEVGWTAPEDPVFTLDEVPEVAPANETIPGLYDGMAEVPEPDPNATPAALPEEEVTAGAEAAADMSNTYTAPESAAAPSTRACPSEESAPTAGYDCTINHSPMTGTDAVNYDEDTNAEILDGTSAMATGQAAPTPIGVNGPTPLPMKCQNQASGVWLVGRFYACFAQDVTRSFTSLSTSGKVQWDGVINYRVYRYSRMQAQKGWWDTHVYLHIESVIPARKGSLNSVRIKNAASYCIDTKGNRTWCNVLQDSANTSMSTAGKWIQFGAAVNFGVTQGRQLKRYLRMPLTVYRADAIEVYKSSETTDSAWVRCDQAVPAGNNNTQGCVIPNLAPAMVYFASDTPGLVNHVRAAQRSGLPGAPPPGRAAMLENEPGWGNRLTRMGSAAAANTNRRWACPSGLGVRSGAPAGTTCDEYPFASTYQGAATGNSVNRPRWFKFCNIEYPQRENVNSGRTGYSRCFINQDEQDEQARIHRGFYGTSLNDPIHQRLIDGDAFFVVLR